eukprot:scaffold3608_cov183-Amphora_coffeaeformis.AAC.13
MNDRRVLVQNPATPMLKPFNLSGIIGQSRFLSHGFESRLNFWKQFLVEDFASPLSPLAFDVADGKFNLF